MWMSKIKKYLQELDRTPLLNAVFIFSMLCIALVFIFAVIYGVEQILGLESAEKIISAISSLATALTLVFLVYQYKMNEVKNYQLTMVDEAKLVLEKIIKQLDKLHEWDGKNILVLDNLLNEMSNHAIDFDSFYEEVNDPALKKILQIRWQDMFLNHYIGISGSIDICTIIRENTINKDNAFELNMINLKEGAEKASQGKVYEGYEHELYCLYKAKDNGLYDLISYVQSHSIFKQYFLDNTKIIKYLEGIILEHDPKKSDPTLYAIIEASITSRK